jgi:low affinity Fe/Cu permease
MRDQFRRLSAGLTSLVGSPWALILAVGGVLAWALSGPLFDFSETWQIMINTVTTIVTFLMVFVIQASQNREAKATQLKLDEIIRALNGARNQLMDVEEASDDVVEHHANEFRELAGADRAADPRTPPEPQPGT